MVPQRGQNPAFQYSMTFPHLPHEAGGLDGDAASPAGRPRSEGPGGSEAAGASGQVAVRQAGHSERWALQEGRPQDGQKTAHSSHRTVLQDVHWEKEHRTQSRFPHPSQVRTQSGQTTWCFEHS